MPYQYKREPLTWDPPRAPHCLDTARYRLESLRAVRTHQRTHRLAKSPTDDLRQGRYLRHKVKAPYHSPHRPDTPTHWWTLCNPWHHRTDSPHHSTHPEASCQQSPHQPHCVPACAQTHLRCCRRAERHLASRSATALRAWPTYHDRNLLEPLPRGRDTGV